LDKADFEAVKPLIYNNYNLAFTGHTHSLNGAYFQDIDGSLYLSVANSTIADYSNEIKYQNGYVVIEYFPEAKVKAIYRKYLKDKKVFVSNTDIGNDLGIKEFNIPSKDQVGIVKEIKETIKFIAESHCEDVNNDLIIFNSDTKAQCTIESIFIEPTICNFPETRTDSENQDGINFLKLEDLLSRDSNYLIYGSKESGKTILIDKILIELTKNYKSYNKVPVLIDFKTIGKREIFSIVKSFIAQSTETTKEILSNYNVRLLVDNFDLSFKYNDQINKLLLFLKSYPKCSIIATHNHDSVNIIPEDGLASSQEFRFDTFFIHSLSGKQIKKLIQLWFQNSQVDFRENLEKLLRNFHELSLPRTPLTVTMFLWIIERQEKKPINNSVLVEMFVENLLEKANFKNIYSETFDFHNKQRLLACVAKEMLEYGDPENSYALEYSKTVSFITKYLKTRFSGNPNIVLENLISRGIIIQTEDNQIRFKAAFFFHYFLSRYIDIDPKFKTEIFTGNNFLNYVDEIEYYTGLKRDDIDVLNFTQEKLLEAFSEINENLTNDPLRIDNYLDTKGSLSSRIDLSNVKQKPTEEELDSAYDSQIASLPVKTNIQSKQAEQNQNITLDKILKLASVVLKNSEEIDDFEKKKNAYQNLIISSISFMIIYRSSLVSYYKENQKQPDNFPKNIDFNLFIRLLPLIHQVTIYNWLGSPKLIPVIQELRIKFNELPLSL
jgi:hypothetical protein